MSLTPGWVAEDEWSRFVRMKGENPVSNLVGVYGDHYFLDNGQEYKKFPRTKEGWVDLCEALKDFES